MHSTELEIPPPPLPFNIYTKMMVERERKIQNKREGGGMVEENKKGIQKEREREREMRT